MIVDTETLAIWYLIRAMEAFILLSKRNNVQYIYYDIPMEWVI